MILGRTLRVNCEKTQPEDRRQKGKGKREKEKGKGRVTQPIGYWGLRIED
jgi:hypothetical protein